MASKPFIAARIPESLNLKLEEHSKVTGEGRTQVLINALSAYLGFTPETESKESAGDRLSLLEKRVLDLEILLKQPQQISLLDTSAITTERPIAKAKLDNKIDNNPDNKRISYNVITSDNKADNIQLATTEEKKATEQPQQPHGEFIGSMKTQDVPKLPGLENEDAYRIKVKLNNTKNTKNQTTRIGAYTIALAESVATNASGKKPALLWDVYRTESNRTDNT